MKTWSQSDVQLLWEVKDLPIDAQVEAFGGRKTASSIISKRHAVRIHEESARPASPIAEDPEEPLEQSTWEEGPNEAKLEHPGLREKVKSLDDLIRVCEIDTEKWVVERWKCKAYAGMVKGADKKPITVQLFSVSADLRRRKGIDYKKEIDILIEEAKAHAPLHRKPELPVRPASGLMLELSIPDLHIGKLAWHEECGESYDSKIAEQLFDEAASSLLHKTSAYEFDEITLVIGNDFINSDNSQNTTTRGTPQASDTRHQKTFKIGRKLIQDLVEHRLRGRAPKINIVIVPGNHDQQTAYFLGETLDAWFKDAQDVFVDNRPTLRKYVQFGKVLIGYTHGDKEKHADLPLIMAQEQKKAWASTLFKEIHTGHLHQRRATQFRNIGEHNGVVVRVLPSLSAAEDWHVSKGYIGNIRSAEAYIWDRECGLVGTAVYNVIPDA